LATVQEISEVKADSLSAAPQQAQVEYYVIRKGNTLSTVAKSYFGIFREQAAAAVPEAEVSAVSAAAVALAAVDFIPVEDFELYWKTLSQGPGK
jgi:hypothetical protein